MTSYLQFFEDSRNFGFEYAISRAKALGFDSVENLALSYKKHIEDVSAVKESLDRHGLYMPCYSILVQLFVQDPAEVLEQMRKHIDAAAALGARYFHHTVFPIYAKEKITNTYDEVYNSVVDTVEYIAKYCNDHGITCLYEPQGAYFNGVEGLSRIFFEMKRRGCDVGICGDMGNSLFVDVDPTEIFKAFAPEIRHVHVKDYAISDLPPQNCDHWETSKGKWLREVEMGTGAVDLAACCKELKKVDYKGAVSLEFQHTDEGFARTMSYISNTMLDAGI